jgi:DNA-binding NtrC family response regulator
MASGRKTAQTFSPNPDDHRKKEKSILLPNHQNHTAPRELLRSGESKTGETTRSSVILAVSPFAGDHASLARIFGQFGPGMRSTRTVAEALSILQAEAVAVVVAESTFPDGRSWKHLLEAIGTRRDSPRLIVTSRIADEHLWAEVLNLGGYDVLTKPFDFQEVSRVVSLAFSSWESAWRQSPHANRIAWRVKSATAD